MQEAKFNALEVLEMAKEIELKGKNFYKANARHYKEKELGEFLLKLAEEEQEHYDIFDRMSKEVKAESESQTNYLYDYQVSAYLQSLVEFSVFPPEAEIEEGLEDIEEILTIGIMAEKDSILFYQEMLTHNDGKTAEILERLLAEEKKHLLDLTEYKNSLS